MNIKKALRSNLVTGKIYQEGVEAKNRVLICFNPKEYYRAKFYRVFHSEMNLESPKFMAEKLIWLTLYYYKNSPLVARCADKIAMRSYIQKCGLSEYLNPILFTYKGVEDIEWNKLPEQFALKCNHGCAYNIICHDKSKLDVMESKRKLSNWMKEDYWKIYGEFAYKNIPHKILCEQYLDTETGKLPVDIKIHCFNGEPQIIMMCTDRDTEVMFTFFDLNWNYLDICYTKTNPHIKKPELLCQMIEMCKILAKPFPFVRIDFYEYKEHPLIGELTFSPEGCMLDFVTDKGQEIMGNMLMI